MKEDFLTVDDADQFLSAHPDVAWIDLILFDMNGIPRGKRFRRDDLRGVAKSGVMMPASVFILDPRGNSIEETNRLWETGDPDILFRILAGSLRAMPLGDQTRAQAVIVCAERDDLDPRGVLRGQVDALKAVGKTPVVAVELEFYVTKPAANGAFTLKTPDGLTDDPDFPKTFGFEEMDVLAPFIDDIYKVANGLGLPIDAVMQESGPGQFEINLKHRDDPVAAALDGLLLKRAVKAAAKAHGLDATFMAKPHHDWCGSGMHIHVSLIDEAGANLFAGDAGKALFQQAIGGLQATMCDFMAVWAQSANAYRRYVPKSYVAMTAHWGFNNRNVALRIPRSNGAGTRVEHRVAGADANPYLVLAGILAGIRHGIDHGIDPGPMAEGLAENCDAPVLPTAWVNALDKFETSPVVSKAFGPAFQDVYVKLKQTERINFERIVTSLDHLWYAQVA
ncbi:MAG: glutamine synthetase family protein [Hyphomicrobium sp.]